MIAAFGFLPQSLNETFEALTIHLESFVSVALETAAHLRRELAQATSSWSSPVEFTPLQLTLLKVLLLLLLGTAVLIAYSWHTYGKVITEKFVRPSTLKEIEELKLSVAKLKLPKEHSPRI